MQITSGTVVNGKIVVEGTIMPEGAQLTVLARGADKPFHLSASDENELLAAIEEIEHGKFITLDQLLATLPQ